MIGVAGARREKWLAGGMSILMVGAVLRPISENWRRKPKDSFPCSHYPMFSKKRGECERVTYVVGVDARGARRPLPYGCIGTGGLNQVRRQVRKIARRGKVAEGDKAVEELCEAVAARLARWQDGRYDDVVAIQLVTGKYRLDDFFTGRPEPEWERVHVTRHIRRGE